MNNKRSGLAEAVAAAHIEEQDNPTITSLTGCQLRAPIRGVKFRGMEEESKGLYRVEFAFASNRELLRSVWGMPYREVTMLDEGAMDSSRVERGVCPLLVDHSAKIESQVGTIRRVWVEKEDGGLVAYCEAIIDSRNPLGSDLVNKVGSGLIRGISFAWAAPSENDYEIEDLEDDPDGAYWRIIYRRWDLLEISFVAVPADGEVGLSATDTSHFKNVLHSLRAARSKTATLDDDMKRSATSSPAAAGAPVAEATPLAPPASSAADATPKPAEAAAPAEREQSPAAKLDFITEGGAWLAEKKTSDFLARQGLTEEDITSLRVESMQGHGMTVADVRARASELMEKAAEDVPHPNTSNLPGAPAINTGKGGRVDLARVIKRAADYKAPDGLEGELSQENQGQIRSFLSAFSGEKNGPSESAIPICLSWNAIANDAQMLRGILPAAVQLEATRERMRSCGVEVQARSSVTVREAMNAALDGISKRVYQVGNTPTGLHTPIFDEMMLLDSLVAEAATIMHCSMFPQILTQDFVIPRQSGEVNVTRSAEGVALAEQTGPSYGNLTWTYGSPLRTRLDISQQSLDQSALLYDSLVSTIRRDFPRELDSEILNGSGSGGVPRGILNVSSLPTVSLGTNGGVPTWSTLTDLATRIGDANARQLGQIKYIMDTHTLGIFEKTAKFTGSTGNESDSIVNYMSGSGMMGGMPMIKGSPVIVDNNLPSDLTKGTGTGLHALIAAIVSQVKIAHFSNFMILVDPYTAANNHQVRLWVYHACDFQHLYDQAPYAAAVDIT